MECTFAVYRFDPAVDRIGRYQRYVIPAESTDKVLDCLNRIRWDQDPTLAFRASCAHGICGSDAMVINGRVALACQKLVRNFNTANHFVIGDLGMRNDVVVHRCMPKGHSGHQVPRADQTASQEGRLVCLNEAGG
jgi:succinate dehydrogenase/fumarate reductase iron-sulfur protein